MRKSTGKIFILVLFLAAFVSLWAYAAGDSDEKIDKRIQRDPQSENCCAGGYNSGGINNDPKKDDIKKLREERSLFLQKIEPLRQSYYEKAMTLNDELSKKNPNAEITAKIHGEISHLRAQFAKEQTNYLIKIKKINPNLLQGSCSSATSNRSSSGASCCAQ
ncbi:MAG: hypothetical protein GY797_02960 [Deltaproteobacteria bacterium]|nr:hypothetical protein [Deltaproteobacteria bacterium]